MKLPKLLVKVELSIYLSIYLSSWSKHIFHFDYRLCHILKLNQVLAPHFFVSLGTNTSYGSPVDWMDSKGEEISMWQAMVDRPDTWIDGTLILRPHMNQRGVAPGPKRAPSKSPVAGRRTPVSGRTTPAGKRANGRSTPLSNGRNTPRSAGRDTPDATWRKRGMELVFVGSWKLK